MLRFDLNLTSLRRRAALIGFYGLGLSFLAGGPGCGGGSDGPGVAAVSESDQNPVEELPVNRKVKTAKGRLVVGGPAGGLELSK